MSLPRITDAWVRSGWVVESSHMPGSCRMLAIWAASFGSIPFTVAAFGPGPSALICVAGLVAGAAVYMRLSRDVPASEGVWGYEDTQARPWRSVDRPPLARVALDSEPAPEYVTVNTGTEIAA